jgi:hypothetical protein
MCLTIDKRAKTTTLAEALAKSITQLRLGTHLDSGTAHALEKQAKIGLESASSLPNSYNLKIERRHGLLQLK